MVTQVKEPEKKVDSCLPRIVPREQNLEELGHSIGVPVRVLPWWGSRRQGAKWLCPAEGGSLKKLPEIRDGVICVWAGPCQHLSHYRGPHTHRQDIEIKDAGSQAILISIRSCAGVISHHLLGVDGSAPYVVRVSQKAQTIDAAFQWLIPKKVREAIIAGLNVKRQGDWFFIPYNREPNLHAWDDFLHYGLYKRNRIYRNHPLVYNGALTRHRASLVVYNTVLGLPCEAPVVKGKIRAPDHPTLTLESWHLAVRNRSHPWRNSSRRNRGLDD